MINDIVNVDVNFNYKLLILFENPEENLFSNHKRLNHRNNSELENQRF
jgi:hypothetical protein